MNFSLVVSDRAIQQIEKAATWFFELSPGLEVQFIKEIERGMNFIQKNPLNVNSCTKTFE
jgi:hypothetical protein